MLSYKELSSSTSAKFIANCTSTTQPPATLRVLPSGCAVSRLFPDYIQKILDFEVREDDVWVITYPKCGTTWTQEMVWLIGNNLDYAKAKNTILFSRFPFIDWPVLGKVDIYMSDTVKELNAMPSPRFIKSHLPKELLPKQLWIKKPKIIYVTREPKDVAVSYYHHYRGCNEYVGTAEEFFQAFLEDLPLYSPFWEHIIEFSKLKNEPNILFNSYEEMKWDLPGIVNKVSNFLGKSLTNDEISQLCHHLSFKSMRANPCVNFSLAGERSERDLEEEHFIRKGEVGSWKTEMSPIMAQKFDEWTSMKTKGLKLFI